MLFTPDLAPCFDSLSGMVVCHLEVIALGVWRETGSRKRGKHTTEERSRETKSSLGRSVDPSSSILKFSWEALSTIRLLPLTWLLWALTFAADGVELRINHVSCANFKVTYVQSPKKRDSEQCPKVPCGQKAAMYLGNAELWTAWNI